MRDFDLRDERVLWPLGALVAMVGAGAALFAVQCRHRSKGRHSDLKRINGIGPALETKLHDNGVHSFAQIAKWSAEDIAEMDARLQFAGRIERDDWVGQARRLSS